MSSQRAGLTPAARSRLGKGGKAALKENKAVVSGEGGGIYSIEDPAVQSIYDRGPDPARVLEPAAC